MSSAVEVNYSNCGNCTVLVGSCILSRLTVCKSRIICEHAIVTTQVKDSVVAKLLNIKLLLSFCFSMLQYIHESCPGTESSKSFIVKVRAHSRQGDSVSKDVTSAALLHCTSHHRELHHACFSSLISPTMLCNIYLCNPKIKYFQ